MSTIPTKKRTPKVGAPLRRKRTTTAPIKRVRKARAKGVDEVLRRYVDERINEAVMALGQSTDRPPVDFDFTEPPPNVPPPPPKAYPAYVLMPFGFVMRPDGSYHDPFDEAATFPPPPRDQPRDLVFGGGVPVGPIPTLEDARGVVRAEALPYIERMFTEHQRKMDSARERGVLASMSIPDAIHMTREAQQLQIASMEATGGAKNPRGGHKLWRILYDEAIRAAFHARAVGDENAFGHASRLRECAQIMLERGGRAFIDPEFAERLEYIDYAQTVGLEHMANHSIDPLDVGATDEDVDDIAASLK